ncbi:hypothetical protein AgCh_000962 [Apium graveolens]
MCQGADRVKQARVQTLKKDFRSLHMKDTEMLDDFYLKINGLVRNKGSLGEEMNESYLVKKLLRAMPSKFLQILSTIEQFGSIKTMSIEEEVSSLKAHEEHMKVQPEHMKVQPEPGGGQMLLTEEEWWKRENSAGKLLLTREEWIKKTCERDGGRGPRDKSNLSGYNFAADYKKPVRRGSKNKK